MHELNRQDHMAKEEELSLLTSGYSAARLTEGRLRNLRGGPKARDLKLRHCFLGRDT